MIRFCLCALVLAVCTTSAFAAGCASPSEVAASRTRWAAARRQVLKAADHDAACRSFAGMFYESVKMRQAITNCTDGSNSSRDISELDSDVDALNDLLANECRG
jgi:hypothetical protein